MALRIYLGIAGVAFMITALFAFIDPDSMAAFAGLAAVDAAGETEIRAIYGGLSGGIGLLLLCGLRSPKLATAGLGCAVFAVGGLGLTRLVLEVFFGDPGIHPNQGIAIALELTVAVAAYVFLRRDLAEDPG